MSEIVNDIELKITGKLEEVRINIKRY